MSLNICSLNSGSNGNCYYIGNQNEAVLIDAGISCAETEKRMNRLGLSMKSVKAIFISHEHVDHISGLPVLSRKYKLPVYITGSTLKNSRMKIEKELINFLQTEKPVAIGQLSITAFRKSHDASDPHSFIISGSNVNIGVFTDIGYPGKELIRFFKQCNAIFLEANYCEEMLESGSYPRYLKKRISGRKGHLSNDQALELFKKHKGPQLTHLILSHLSENNNDPELVKKLFKPYDQEIRIIIASRFEETELYSILPQPGLKKRKTVRRPEPNREQLSLFD